MLVVKTGSAVLTDSHGASIRRNHHTRISMVNEREIDTYTSRHTASESTDKIGNQAREIKPKHREVLFSQTEGIRRQGLRTSDNERSRQKNNKKEFSIAGSSLAVYCNAYDTLAITHK